MSSLNQRHQELTNGEGLCSKPMWDGYGYPNGFCDKPAYGRQENNERAGYYENGKFYRSYVPALACYAHGGPAKQQEG